LTLRSEVSEISQFNAIRNNAANGDIYGGSWAELRSFSYNRDNQVAAIFGLVNGAQTVPQDSQNSANASNSKRRIGAIAGGVLGGLVVASTCATLFLARKRRHAQGKFSKKKVKVEPFVEKNEAPPANVQYQGKHRRSIHHAEDHNSPTPAQGSEDRTVDQIVQLVTARMQATQGQYNTAIPPPAYSNGIAQSTNSDDIYSRNV
jgi:hypothetical protein